MPRHWYFAREGSIAESEVIKADDGRVIEDILMLISYPHALVSYSWHCAGLFGHVPANPRVDAGTVLACLVTSLPLRVELHSGWHCAGRFGHVPASLSGSLKDMPIVVFSPVRGKIWPHSYLISGLCYDKCRGCRD